MSNSKLFLSFSLIVSFVSFTSSTYFNTARKCSPQQTRTLLLFKQNLSSINFQDYDPQYNSAGEMLFSFNYHPIMMNWSTSTDCCKWDGITCNQLTGDVIGIDLSYGMLQGTIHPNTSLFDLPHLQRLNLAYNNFNASQLPREIGKFSNSLTHLNISSCGFTGDIPREILFLPKLVSLDLSSNHGLQMHPYILKNLLQNSTHLKEVDITSADIGWVLPTYLNISSSIKSLNLGWTGLQGKLPENMFNLPKLENLDLSANWLLTGPLPKINKSINIPLNSLALGNTNLSGETFGSIGRLTSLNALDLSECGLFGPFPKSLYNLTHLTYLSLEGNMLNGPLPSLLFTLPLIEHINIGFNLFSGGLPLELFKCRSLKVLILRQNLLDGGVDQGFSSLLFIELINLNFLDLQSNDIKGVWNFETLLSSLPNLRGLDLSYSGLTVFSDNSTAYVNPGFWFLNLASCNLNVFPQSLRAMKNLQYLCLSGNNIQGHIPDLAGEIGGNRLISVDLSNNSITGLPEFQWDGLTGLSLQSNMIQGPFPASICNMSKLQDLDMSNNSFDGVVPQCLGNIKSLGMIYLETNRFHGPVPNMCTDHGHLKWLILNENRFEGEVPSSLSKCRDLEILDLGNNHLNGTFPGWLGDLPGLQVIVLKSNNFHGPIGTSSTTKLPLFPSLRVLDVSYNRFAGHLPRIYFQYFNAMKNMVRTSSGPKYFQFSTGKYYSVIIEVKGRQLSFPQLSVDYTIIDLSNNKFEGEIPDIVGTLNSLIVLNLSHNNLNGQIPHVLGSLLNIESLDLSWNKLTGEIPQSLSYITTLEVLNLSHNHLVGRIPQGTQFNTFEGNSFGGNLGLCGFPLPKHCEHPSSPHAEVADGDEGESGFTWKVVMLGYGCGTLPGLLIGYFMLSTGRPKWLNALVVGAKHMIEKRKTKRRRYIFIGK